jgi:hypothetical protein
MDDLEPQQKIGAGGEPENIRMQVFSEMAGRE